MLMLLIFSILVASFLLVIGSILGKSWKFSLEIGWWRSKRHVRSENVDENKYQAVSAHDILTLLNESQVCIDKLRCLGSLRDWDNSIVSSAYLQQSPPLGQASTAPSQPDWDIVRITAKWACLRGLWAWTDCLREAWLMRWLERRWCCSSTVYQRYWHEEEDGSCWLVRTCVDRTDWTFYLARPSPDEDQCTLSVVQCSPDSWITAAGSALISHSLTAHIQSFRTFARVDALQNRSQSRGNFTAPSLRVISDATPALKTDRPSSLELCLKDDRIQSSARPNETNDHSRPRARSSDAGTDQDGRSPFSVPEAKISAQFVVENGSAINADRRETWSSPTSSRRSSPARGSPVPAGEGPRSSPVRSSSTPKSMSRTGRAATLNEDSTVCRERKLNEWVDSTTIAQASNYTTRSLGLSCDAQYRTCSNLCASQVVTELTYASNLDLSLKNEDQAKSTCGWMFSHTEKDVLIMKKHSRTSNAGIFSFIGKGIVHSSPRAVWDAVRNPRTRFTYDDTVKKMEILHDFGNGLKVVHMQHEVNNVFKREARDFCVLHGEKTDGDRYILTMSSIDWLPCPVDADVTRGQFLSSGWMVEPTFQDGRLLSMVTYLSQMNLKTTSSHFVDDIAAKQPLAIAQLRQLVVPHVRRGSRTPVGAPAPSVVSATTRETESGRSSS